MAADRVTIVVDPAVCSATGNCVAIAPELFELEPGDDIARVLVDPVETDRLISLASEAAECCPLAAIELLRQTSDRE
jgi:ferredoxin